MASSQMHTIGETYPLVASGRFDNTDCYLSQHWLNTDPVLIALQLATLWLKNLATLLQTNLATLSTSNQKAVQSIQEHYSINIGSLLNQCWERYMLLSKRSLPTGMYLQLDEISEPFSLMFNLFFEMRLRALTMFHFGTWLVIHPCSQCQIQRCQSM